MSEEQKPFSEEYVGGKQTTTAIVTLEAITTPLESAEGGTTGSCSTSGTLSVSTPLESAEVGTESVSTVTPYGLAKPRRIVIRAKVSHEPQS